MPTTTKPNPTSVDDIVAMILKIPTTNETRREAVAGYIAGVIDARDARLPEAEKREANLLEVLGEARADLEYVTEHHGYENTEAMALTLSRVIAALEGGDDAKN